MNFHTFPSGVARGQGARAPGRRDKGGAEMKKYKKRIFEKKTISKKKLNTYFFINIWAILASQTIIKT